MSKKLLASLIALTMVSAYACGGDDDKDDKGSSCTLGEISCVDGATAIKVCNNKGEWLDTTCSDYKQDVPNGVCQSNNCVTSGTTPGNPPTGECTNDTYQCTGQDLYQCVNQAWSKAKTCPDTQVCDVASKGCKDKETPGPVDQTCTNPVATGGNVGDCCDKDTYQQTCTDGNAHALVCWDNKVAQWDCADNDCKANAEKPLQVVCKKDSSQPATCDNPVTTGGNVGDCCDKATYQQTCTDSNAHALVCWDNKVAQWDCADNDCKANTEKPLQVVCKKGSSQPATCDNPVTTGGKVGDCCDRTTYQQTCTDSNAHALVCWDDKVTQWDCADNDCSKNTEKPLQVVCKKGSSEPTTCDNPVTTGGKVGDCCDKATYQQTCTDSNAHALVCWDNKVTQWDCANNNCSKNTEKPLQVVCEKGTTTPEACTGEDYTGTCAADKKTAVVCVKGETKNFTCFNDICETRKDGTIYCPKDQKAIDNEEARKACEDKEQIKEGGKVGDCCDTENYKPAGCDTAKNSGLRCSTGVIVEWTCTGTKKCKFDPESTEYPGGKYSCE